MPHRQGNGARPTPEAIRRCVLDTPLVRWRAPCVTGRNSQGFFLPRAVSPLSKRVDGTSLPYHTVAPSAIQIHDAPSPSFDSIRKTQVFTAVLLWVFL